MTTIKNSLPVACVLLPTYNEAENIEKTIFRILKLENITTHKIEILVIDDNSTDQTQEIVSKLIQIYKNIHMISGKKIGLGDAYKRGFNHAIKTFSPDLMIQMDSDGQHDPMVIRKFIDHANNGYELIIGSRYIEGALIPSFSFWRKSISIIGNFLVRYLGGAYMIKDCTSGFRCIKTTLLKQVDFKYFFTKGYSFQSSLICELLRKNAIAIEVPITFNEREAGSSKLTLYDQIEFILFIVKIRFRNSADFTRYSIVGLCGTAINFLIYWVLTRLNGMSPELASLIAIESAIITNFLFNNFWTFKKRKTPSSIFKRFYQYHIIAGIIGGVNYLCFLAMINIFFVYDLVSLLIGISIGAIFNYAGNSLWVFRRKGQDL